MEGWVLLKGAQRNATYFTSIGVFQAGGKEGSNIVPESLCISLVPCTFKGKEKVHLIVCTYRFLYLVVHLIKKVHNARLQRAGLSEDHLKSTEKKHGMHLI